ncbi:transcriptional regulator, TetR family [Mucilaginibacter pineti]|uniref:Transcriptional regulator, TetR family n=1 Tax=Mucilaginibacter pineti TaxID=1391627 RepID=A0A1G7NSM1_9SPHI|nr:TetR/AcrR family transcriptional regulator [Mucilaginibacter pineti]SDF77034.1 transcriptional regulator, TetR family [Mucilaginibacter pineti]
MKNREETERKLKEAVGELIKLKGFTGLKISKIARLADVDRKLVYRYFGGLEGLIEAYILENDYWMLFSDILKEIIQESGPGKHQATIVAILQNQFRFFYSGHVMQRLILFEISQPNDMMRSIHKAREAHGQVMFERLSTQFVGSNVDIRAITALLIGGIYYAILHARFNGGMISDIDIKTEAGQQSILNALDQIIGWAFDEASKTSSKEPK